MGQCEKMGENFSDRCRNFIATTIYHHPTLARVGIIVWFITLPILYCCRIAYKWIIQQYVKLCKPEFGKIVDPISLTLGDDNHKNTPYNMGICCSLQLDGNISLQELTKRFERNVLNAKLNGGDMIRYPELKQYCEGFMGYRFWKYDANFNIKNHIYEEGWPKTENESSLEGIHQHYVNRIFPVKRSPWEMILIRDTVPQNEVVKTLIIFRIHHFVCDSKSICKLLMGCLGQKKGKLPEALKPTQSVKAQLWNKLRFPYDLFLEMNAVTSVAPLKKHPLYINDQPKWKAPVFVAFSEKVSLQQVKSLARQAGTRPASVICSIIGGAIGKLMIELGYQDLDSGIPAFTLLNKENHPDGLVNHVNAAKMRLPTDVKNSSPLERLLSFNREYYEVTSGNRLHVKMSFLRMALNPVNFGRRILPIRESFDCLVQISNQALGEEGFSINGRPCCDFKLSVGCLQLPCGLIILPHSYKESIQYSISASSSLLDGDGVGRLAKLLVKEYRCLAEEIQKHFIKNQ